MSGETAAASLEARRRQVADVGVGSGLRADLGRMLQHAWSADTSFDPAGWTDQLPELGQCAVTALLVQDFLGGSIVRAQVYGTSHYWNALDDGTELDLTRGQFSSWPDPISEQVPRDYLAASEDTVRRYRILRSRLGRLAAE